MISRREFVANVAATTAAVTIVPRHVLGRGLRRAERRLNIAGIGVGGMGRTNLLNLGLDNNIVALCDVDWGYAGPQWTAETFAGALKREEERLLKTDLTPESRKNSEHRVGSLKRIAAEDLPRIKRYTDYRLMFEQQKDIDAVVVATPDHMHAPIAMAALDLEKHVYVQKPLCWSVDEARKLSRKARQTPKAVTQMGNQGHSWDDGRKAVEWVQSGAIGDVTRSARVDQSSALLLAAGHSAAGAAAHFEQHALEHERRDGAAGQRDGHLFGARRVVVGSVPRRGAGRASITRCITRSTGAAGSTGAAARWATWART